MMKEKIVRVDSDKQEKQKRQEDKAAGTAVLCIFAVLFLTWGAYVGVVIGLLLGHASWLIAHLKPITWQLALWSGFGMVPLCLLLAAFPRTRLAAGMGFFTISGIFTFVTSTASAIYVYAAWRWVGLIFGSMLVGYGILPTGLVAALLQHRWDIAGEAASGSIMTFSTMYFGLTLMTLSFSSAPLRVTVSEIPHDEQEIE